MKNIVGKPLFLFLTLCCLISLTSIASVALAESHILGRGLFVDPSGQMTVQEVSKQRFTPIGQVLTQGYTKKASWLKIELAPSDVPLVLRIRPTYLDQLKLYWRQGDSLSDWQEMVTGDRTPLQQRPIAMVSLGFPIDTANATTYYIRLQTTSTSLLNVEAMTWAQVQRQELFDQGVQIVYYGFMLWMLLWAISDFVIYRQRVVGCFIAMQCAQILYNLSVTGYLAFLFPTSAFGDYALSLFVLIVMPVSLVFHRTLFSPFEPSKFALRILDLFILAGPLLLLTYHFGNPQTALYLNALVLLSLPPLFLWLAFTARRQALPGIKALRTIYVLFSVLIVTVLLPTLGSFESIELYLGATTLQGLMIAFLMTVFLFLRSRRLQRDSLRARIELERYGQRLSDQEIRMEDQTRFMDMLTHELKTPVSVIKLTSDMLEMSNVKRDRINRSIQTITGVIDRCRLSLQVEYEKLLPIIDLVDLAALVEDVRLSQIDPQRIQVTTDGVFKLQTDIELLKIIIHNLLDNALKYAPLGSPITLDVAQRNIKDNSTKQTVVTVCNALGSMMFPDPEAIFEKYHRGVGAGVRGGSGLGLHLARELALLLNASLTCEVHEGRISFVLVFNTNANTKDV